MMQYSDGESSRAMVECTWLDSALYDSTTHYHGSTWLYLALLHSIIALLHPTTALLGST